MRLKINFVKLKIQSRRNQSGKLILIISDFQYFSSPVDSQMSDVSMLKLFVMLYLTNRQPVSHASMLKSCVMLDHKVRQVGTMGWLTSHVFLHMLLFSLFAAMCSWNSALLCCSAILASSMLRYLNLVLSFFVVQNIFFLQLANVLGIYQLVRQLVIACEVYRQLLQNIHKD